MKILCLTILFTISVGLHAQKPSIQTKQNDLMELIAKAEQKFNIPRNLLLSIACAESGRQTADGSIQLHPFAIQSGGKSWFPDNKHQAIQIVKTLQRKRVANIDVGCMQVNLMHHPQAFETLQQAFDPAHNIYYAAFFLHKLAERFQGNWLYAFPCYHSYTPSHQNTYRRKVLSFWKTLANSTALHTTNVTKLSTKQPEGVLDQRAQAVQRVLEQKQETNFFELSAENDSQPLEAF